jgi:NTE family protein
VLPSAKAHGKNGAIGLALAGGGPQGALYEIGALRALDEAIDRIDFNSLDIYTGVSAGAYICSCLANGISPTRLCHAMGHLDPGEHLFRKQDPGEHVFTENIFFTPAFLEYLRRGRMAPHLIGALAWKWLWSRSDSSRVMEAVSRLSEALPMGLFDSEPIHRYFKGIFSTGGRTDDFRRLRRRLIVVATDLDSGQARLFGEPGSDHVPISKAIQASSAFPGLYPPVLIDGRYYVDGILLKTMHASVPLQADAGLVICVNPLVPINMDASSEIDDPTLSGQLVDFGLPMVLSQTLRTFIHSRLSVGMAAYAPRFPDQDIVLFEPAPDEHRVFFTDTLSLASRRSMCEHAYEATRHDVLSRFDELAPVFARHGLRLRRDVLEDRGRDLWTGVGLPTTRSKHVSENLDRVLARLEALVDAQEPDRQPRS